jgi:hypothetical protein
MPALDAFHQKVNLAEDLRTGQYEQMMNGRVASVRGDGGWDAMPSRGVYDRSDTGQVVVRRMQAAVETGYAYYVAPHMDALVTAAAESLPEDYAPQVSDLPTPQGFLWIPGGMTVIDIRGRILKYNAALWSAYGGRVFIWWLTDKYDTQDMTNLELKLQADPTKWSQFPQLTPNGESVLWFGEPVPLSIGMTVVLPPEIRTGLFYDPDRDQLTFHSEKGYSAEELQELMSTRAERDPAARWLLACWLLMQQSLTSLDQEPVPRQLRKLGARARIPDQHVTVIDLRSKPSRGDGESAVEWSHRWLVRGYWRRQRYKVDGEWQEKVIYIHPHVKGPEGKPLVIKDHVYNLKR